MVMMSVVFLLQPHIEFNILILLHSCSLLGNPFTQNIFEAFDTNGFL